MKKTILFLALFLASCSPTPTSVVEDFLTALAAKDEARLLTLVCADYEFDALLEFDSYASSRPHLMIWIASRAARM